MQGEEVLGTSQDTQLHRDVEMEKDSWDPTRVPSSVGRNGVGEGSLGSSWVMQLHGDLGSGHHPWPQQDTPT